MGRILSDSSSTTLSFSNFTLYAKATTTAPTAPLHNLTSQASPEEVRKGGNFNPTLAVVVSAMIVSFFVVGFASGYLRRWIWGYQDETRHSELMRRRRMNSFRPTGTQTSLKSQRGLDPEIVAAMPLVRYKDLPADEQAEKYFECPVCLAVFDATDSLKLLLQCAHAFHSDCIDEWFRSHSTCPLCRVSLACPVGKASTGGDANRGGRRLAEDDSNPGHSIRVPADFDVVDVDVISGFESRAEIPTVSAPTADASVREEQDVEVNPRSILCSNAGGFSFVPAIRIDVAPVKSALASIRRSNSVGTDLRLIRHARYVVDSEGTQHHRNFQVHAIAIDGREENCSPTSRLVNFSGAFTVASGAMTISSKVTGLPCSTCPRTCVWCTRRSVPNLRQIGPV